MKEIGTINLHRMNNGAHFLYVSNVLARAEADTKVSEKAAAQVSALKTAVAQEDRDLKLSQKSLLTDDIAQADRDRDQLYIGYKQAVKGFLNLPVENLAQAAKVLNQHIIDYAIDPQEQLDKETGMLVNFLADLEGKYAEQVSALSLTPFVTALKEANAQLQERFSPELNRRAGEYLARLTGEKYTSLSLNRELEASAAGAGDVLPRRSLFLSKGTVDQVYLAVRLAVYDLCLGERRVPLVLDDALAAFDDGRMANALDLLLERAREDQVLFFTCQRREGAYLAQKPGVTRAAVQSPSA